VASLTDAPLDPDARVRRIEASLEHVSSLVGDLTSNVNMLVRALTGGKEDSAL
jgi:hypothetical protein